ncbi:MAG: TauD/TfdA family dioxygenase [Actinomycetota bacterium]
MTLLHSRSSATVAADGHVEVHLGGRATRLHPQWLREQSTEPGQIEQTNRQRLFTPLDIEPGLVAVEAALDGDTLTVAFSDGHRCRLSVTTLTERLGWTPDPEAPPAPIAWEPDAAPFPTVSWPTIAGDLDEPGVAAATVGFLGDFAEHGFVIMRDTPVVEGTVAEVANHIGYISGNNFGWVFDVRNEPKPTDLAYTAIGLKPHTDGPYRKSQPGLQLLHCLANDAEGGDSVLVDGLAATEALRRERLDLHEVLATVEVEFRYDMGNDVVIDRGPVIQLDAMGRFRQLRFNTKLDFPVPVDGVDLDAWYEGRRWLAEWMDDPAHQVAFRLDAGDLMFMDNHRVLHARTAFDPTTGRRHLQGCYIEHNGPDTRYRLAMRRVTGIL